MDEITFTPKIIECANDVVMGSDGNLDNVSASDKDLLDQNENASVKEETTKKSSLSGDLGDTRDAPMEGIDDQNEDSAVQKDMAYEANSDTRYEETSQTDAKKEQSPAQEDKDMAYEASSDTRYEETSQTDAKKEGYPVEEDKDMVYEASSDTRYEETSQTDAKKEGYPVQEDKDMVYEASSDTRYEETSQTDAKKEQSPVQEDKDMAYEASSDTRYEETSQTYAKKEGYPVEEDKDMVYEASSDTRYEETSQTDAKKERSPVQEDKDCEVSYFVEVTFPENPTELSLHQKTQTGINCETKVDTEQTDRKHTPKISSLLSKYRSIQKETNTEITNNSRLVRIVNLPENVTESSLEDLISRNHPLVGNIKKIYVREDKSLQLVYAFVLFEHVSDASKVAQEWQNYTYEDKKLDVALIGPKLPYKKYKVF